MTIKSDNRSEAVTELRKLKAYSITRVPLENPIGPVYRINAPSNNAALMIAGQSGLELNFKYFILVESGSSQSVSGYMYQGTGGLSTETTYSITVAFTNDEDYELKYNAYECSSLLDDFTFTTHGGRVALWTLFGSSLVGGTIIMLSALSVEYPNWNDPNYYSKWDEAERISNGRLIGGGILMGVSLLFTIPLW